ncbi:MAG: ROK family protein [Nitritalea sp.]
MHTQEENFLAIDVGGTHLKIGIVSTKGQVLHFYKEDTKPYREQAAGFPAGFIAAVGKYLEKHPEVQRVGIGLPGLITKDRSTPLEIPAIPSLNNFPLRERLLEAYPDKQFFLENDAAAAAIGEYHFGTEKTPADFLFITMGTGIGSALVLNGQVFKGANGNAMEMGHMLSRGNEGLERLIGRDGILRIKDRMIKGYPDKAGILRDQPLGTHLLVDTAREGNEVSLMVFEEVGRILGESIVSTIRIVDVHTVYFGGGISAGLEFMMPALERTIRQYLTTYYVEDLRLSKATLENNAGTLGAAALCFLK